jgi:RES domain-containing protein
MPPFQPARLSGVPLTASEATGYRNQAPGFDGRNGEGARRAGGRYNPPRSFPVIYLCLTKPCVVAELTAQAIRQSIQPADLLPRELWSVAAQLDKTLDLRAESVLQAAGVEASDLVRPEHVVTQQIGEAAHERGVQAVFAPSATGVDDIVAIFPENLGSITLQVELLQVWSTLEDLL